MKNKQFKVGAVLSYVTIVINILTGLIYTPWLLKMLGDNDYAMYTLAMSVISMFLLDFGIGSAVSRHIAIYVVNDDVESINNFMGVVYKLYLGIDFLIFLCLFTLSFFLDDIYSSLSSENLITFKTVYLIVSIYSLIQFPFVNLNGILFSYEKFVFPKLCDLVQKVAIVITVFFLLEYGGGVYELVFVNAFYGLGIIVIKYCYIRRNTRVKSNLLYWNKGMVKDIFVVSAWMTVILVTQRLFYNIAPSILAILGLSSAITLFTFASSLEGYVYTIGNAINGMFLPRLTRYAQGENGQADTMRLMLKVGRYIILLMGLIVVGWATVGRRFVCDLWLGSDYELVYLAGLILMIPDWLALPQQVASTALVVHNKIKYQAYAYIGGGLLNIILAVLLTKAWGVMGTCIAICFSNMVVFFVMNWAYHKKLGLNVFAFAQKIYLGILPYQIGVLVIGIIIDYFNPLQGLVGFLMEGLLISIIYMIIMYKFVLTTQERETFMRKIKGKKQGN